MTEIKCPNCNTTFTIDEAQYESIVHQIRTAEFEKDLNERLALAEKTSKAEIEAAKSKATADATKAAAEKDVEIAKLKADLKSKEDATKLAVSEAVSKLKDELNEVKNTLTTENAKLKIEAASLKESHTNERQFYEKEIVRLQDFKAKLSVKLLGETLEQHCEVAFNQMRSIAFPRAKFGKDNDASSGTKGDYIFRDYSEDGIEYISIMFEMKNEADTSSTKKKNTDFLKKLDEDRRKKGCEYAVLVSTLEADSELYAGITDVSHEYEKMFVIRPQFFIPMISLLRNAAQATIQARAELEQARKQNIDYTNFEADLNQFKEGFESSANKYRKRVEDAIAAIDKSIAQLEATKENLRKAGVHLNAAENKVEDLTIKKLTKNNPTMQAKFAEIESRKPEIES